MAGKNDITISLDLDDRKAQQNLKKLSKEVTNLDDDFEDVETAGKALARAIEQSADDMISEIDATRSAIDRMETALEGTDFDATKVVGDLKRLGLTAEDVEADAEALADALKRTGDVKVHAATKGFDDVGDAVSSVGDEASRTGDTMSGFIGGTVGELPGISGALGPVAEGLGQLTEGAISGEVAFKSLAAAGVGMAALGLTVQAITGHFEKQAAIKAFDAAKVEDYTDALGDADSTLQGINDKLRDAAGVQINLFGDEKDVTEQLVQAGLDLDSFSRLLNEGEAAWTEWADKARAAGVDSELVEVSLIALESEHQALTKAQEANAVTSEFLGKTQDGTTAAIDRSAERTAHLAQTTDDKAQADADAEDAANEHADAIDGLSDAYSGLRDELSDRSAYLGLGSEFDALEEKGQAAFDAAATGAEDAEVAAREYEQAQIGLKQSVIGYAEEVGNIPERTVTDILALIDQGRLAEAETALANLEKDRTTNLRIRLTQEGQIVLPGGQRIMDSGGALAAGQSALVAERRPEIVNGQLLTAPQVIQGPARVISGQATASMMQGPPSITNVTLNVPYGYSPRDIEDLKRRYTARTGR